MAILKDVLQFEERVLEQFSGIEYQEKDYNCAVTNLRTILFTREGQKFTEIKHESISHISLEKDWYIDLIYLIPISFGLAFFCLFSGLITYFPLSFTPAHIDLLRAFLYPGIVFIAIGIGAVFIYFTRVKFSALIESQEEYQLFSGSETLLKFIQIIKNAKSGKMASLEPKNLFGLSKYPIIVSKIVLLISTIFFLIVGWFGVYPAIRALFYIPFLLLVIGFLIGLSGYNEKNVKPIRFKLGLLLLFIGMNFMWFLMYVNILPLPGIITTVLGAGLFLEC